MTDAEEYATKECCSTCKNINHFCKEKCECWTFAKNGFLAGLNEGRPKWHKVADGDLPKGNCENILLYNKDHFCVTHSYSLGYYENGVFYNDCEMEEDTIAWCEIPQYTGE